MIKVITKVNVVQVEETTHVATVRVDVGTHTKSGTSEPYTGSYNWVPTNSEQIIPIKDLCATQNIKIEPIPNNYGLITRIGSKILVS